MKSCKVLNCTNTPPGRARLCNTHYYRLKRYGSVQAKLIKPGLKPIKCMTCKEFFIPFNKSKYCNKACYFISKFRDKKPCSVKNCVYKAPAQSKGLCVTHYVIWRNHGDPNVVSRNRRGMGTVSDGYRSIAQRREHRLIMEKHIGRKLEKHEVVHHKNHDRLDNQVKNLEVMTRSKHCSIHNIERWEEVGKESFGR